MLKNQDEINIFTDFFKHVHRPHFSVLCKNARLKESAIILQNMSQTKELNTP